jgi:hypothetical protein
VSTTRVSVSAQNSSSRCVSALERASLETSSPKLRRRIFSEMTADDQRVGWVGDWARKHYKQMIVVRGPSRAVDPLRHRVPLAKGYWWGLVFLPFLALDLWLLRSLVRYARMQGP